MCGLATTPSTEDIVRDLRLKMRTARRFDKNLKVAPTQLMPVITNQNPDELQYFTWSLIPPFSQTGKPDFKMSTFNATVERLNSSPLWKPLMGKKHCVIITSGFYEWNYDDPIKKKGPHPHYIHQIGSNYTFMAGLWSEWVNKETGEIVPSCTMITLPANEMMAKIHNTKARMPAFLTENTREEWINDRLSLTERMKCIEPVANDFLEAVEIEKVGEIF